MIKILEIEPYFNSNSYAKNFFDILIKENLKTKESIFKELKIPYMTYQRLDKTTTDNAKNIILKLEDYFQISHLSLDKYEIYDKLINDFIIDFYYRSNNIKKHEAKIKECISENNYLKPIFEMLLLLLKLTGCPHELAYQYIDEFKSLSKCDNGYFGPGFKEIYLLISILLADKKSMSYNKLLKEINNAHISLKGLIYRCIASRLYKENNYDLMLYFIEKSRNIFTLTSNYNRLMDANISYYFALNMLGENQQVYIESYNQLLYLSRKEQDFNLYYRTKIYYFVACMELKKYEDILKYIEIEDKDNNGLINNMFLLLVYYVTNKTMFNKLIKEIDNNSNLTVENKKILNIIVSYLKKEIKINNPNLIFYTDPTVYKILENIF